MTSLISYDAVRLHYRRWPSTQPRAVGTVQILHGLGEHIGRYSAVAAALNEAGWHVGGHDMRGHGRSEGRRGKLPDELSLLRDVAAMYDELRSDGPHILLGHSLGGLVAARFVAEGLSKTPARWSRRLDGLMLSSPAFDIGLGVWQRLLLGVLAPLAPNLGMGNGLKPKWLSRDPAVVQAYQTDRMVHDRVSPRLVRFMQDSAVVPRNAAPVWPLRTLLMWAGDDRCVRPQGSAAFAAAAPAAVLTAKVFPGLYHEIFNEPERALVLRHLIGWLARFDTSLSQDIAARQAAA
jgi:alpha-beta hydrolase superfamily lysophospholipase